jgi:hypothetical protein
MSVPETACDADACADGEALVSGALELLASADALGEPEPDAEGEGEPDEPPQAARAIARTPTRISLRCIRHLHAVVRVRAVVRITIGAVP